MDAKPPPVVRDEHPDDREQVRIVNEAAFGRSDEADLIDRLRVEGAVLLSLVAEIDRQIIGHILFSRMTVETAQGPVPPFHWPRWRFCRTIKAARSGAN